jgi:hypothetical protein
MSRDDAVEITVEVIKETAAAVLVTDGDIEVWLPKSQITLMVPDEGDETRTMEIPEWLAVEKGLV